MAPAPRWPFPRDRDDKPENADAGRKRHQPVPPEGSTESQPDIGHRTQSGLADANRSDDAQAGSDARPPLDDSSGKSTQFDGNPNPQGDDKPGLLKPHDDTPAILKKKSGPRN